MPPASLQCTVVTPEQTVRDGEAQFVALMLYDGEIGIGPGHTPLVGRLGPGEMRITDGQDAECYYVEGGFVEVLDNRVTVLTHRAIPAKQVDELVAQEELASALSRRAVTAEQVAARDRVVEQSRAQIRVARRAR